MNIQQKQKMEKEQHTGKKMNKKRIDTAKHDKATWERKSKELECDNHHHYAGETRGRRVRRVR